MKRPYAPPAFTSVPIPVVEELTATYFRMMADAWRIAAFKKFPLPPANNPKEEKTP